MTIQKYLNILQNDGIIITNTDTVPAIICNGLSQKAVKKIYDVKKRNINKAIAIFCPDIATADEFVEINQCNKLVFTKLADAAITLILPQKANSILADNLNKNNQTIGVRIPNNDFLKELMHLAKFPLAATSANISSQDLKIENIEKDFNLKVDLIDLKDDLIRQTSSIFQIISEDNIKTLRKGDISDIDLKKIFNYYL